MRLFLLLVLIYIAMPVVIIALGLGAYYVAALMRGLTQPYYPYGSDDNKRTDTFTVRAGHVKLYERNGYYYDNDYEEN